MLLLESGEAEKAVVAVPYLPYSAVPGLPRPTEEGGKASSEGAVNLR